MVNDGDADTELWNDRGSGYHKAVFGNKKTGNEVGWSITGSKTIV